ncbi:MAG TPA: hypothetical protein VMY37_11295 [Thermoguttaceae bacterium]|nr:hypothetical protein [Thermoguttaceae bacterium]
MPNRLVKVASRLSLWEAELARARLASGGISAWLGNANLVLWAWHYRDAVGGVTLHVLDSDAELAREIIDPARTQARDDQPPWTCPTCSRPVDGSWEICWNCGRFADGSQPPATACQDAVQGLPRRAEPRAGNGLITMAVLAIMALLISTGSLYAGMLAWAVLGVSVALYRATAGGGGEDSRPEDGHFVEPQPIDDPAWESLERRRRMGESIALRAWRASVLGFFCFPPLLLYSGRLLIRLNLGKTPVGRAGLRRWLGAWCVTGMGILLFGSLFLLVLAALSDDPFCEASEFVRGYFDFANGNRR